MGTENAVLVEWDVLKAANSYAKSVLLEEDGWENEDAALSHALNNEAMLEMEWEDTVARLTELLRAYEVKPEMWYVQAKNFGWRNLDGEKSLTARNGTEFLQKILPETECRFQITAFTNGEIKGLHIRNYHHDSPTGESYYCYPILEEWWCAYCGETFFDQGALPQDPWGARICEECAEIHGYEVPDVA